MFSFVPQMLVFQYSISPDIVNIFTQLKTALNYQIIIKP